MKFREITACSKLQVPKIEYGVKAHVACSNTDLFSLYYEPWHVRKADILKWNIQNPGIVQAHWGVEGVGGGGVLEESPP